MYWKGHESAVLVLLSFQVVCARHQPFHRTGLHRLCQFHRKQNPVELSNHVLDEDTIGSLAMSNLKNMRWKLTRRVPEPAPVLPCNDDNRRVVKLTLALPEFLEHVSGL